MKTRIISAVSSLCITFCCFIFRKIGFALSVFVIAVIAGHEFMNAGMVGGYSPLNLLYIYQVYRTCIRLKGMYFHLIFMTV